MTKTSIVIGQRFGRLVVTEERGVNNDSRKQWLCRCDCGVSRVVVGRQLLIGSTRSCGCLRRETTIRLKSTHGLCDLREHNIWANMLARCRNPKNKFYDRYGGRGITVCDRWKSFANFYQDMGSAPGGYSIDRIDNDGDYEPSNCRWATSREQSANSTLVHLVEFDGQQLPIAEWSRRFGVPAARIGKRLASGWDAEQAITRPVRAGQH